VRRLFVDGLSLLDRVRRRRGHVVLVVFGEHLARVEDAVAAELALCHHSFPFAEQIGQDPAIDYRHILRRVGDDELNGEAVRLALQGAGHHQSADAERAPMRHLFRFDLRGREEKYEILPERGEHEGGSHAEGNEAARDHRQPFLPGLHRSPCVAVPWRRRRARALRLRNASSAISAITRPSVTR